MLRPAPYQAPVAVMAATAPVRAYRRTLFVAILGADDESKGRLCVMSRGVSPMPVGGRTQVWLGESADLPLAWKFRVCGHHVLHKHQPTTTQGRLNFAKQLQPKCLPPILQERLATLGLNPLLACLLSRLQLRNLVSFRTCTLSLRN